jgi:hypothetical protein
MEEITREDKERLFEKMEQIELNQSQMDTRFDTTGKVFGKCSRTNKL